MIKEKILLQKFDERIKAIRGFYINEDDRNIEVNTTLMTFKIMVQGLYENELVDRKTYENIDRMISKRLEEYAIEMLDKQIPLFEDGRKQVCVEIDGEEKVIEVNITTQDSISSMREKTDCSTVIGRGKMLEFKNVMVVNIDTIYYGFIM